MNSYARVKSGYLSLEMVVQLATGGRAGRACGRTVGARGATPSGLGATLNFGYALPLYNVRCSAWDMACVEVVTTVEWRATSSVALFVSNQTSK